MANRDAESFFWAAARVGVLVAIPCVSLQIGGYRSQRDPEDDKDDGHGHVPSPSRTSHRRPQHSRSWRTVASKASMARGLIAHGQSIQCLFDATQTHLQIADGRCLIGERRLGVGKYLLYSLQLCRVLSQGSGVCAHLAVYDAELLTDGPQVGQCSVDAVGSSAFNECWVWSNWVLAWIFVAGQIAQRCDEEGEHQSTDDPPPATSRSSCPGRGDGVVALDIHLG